MARLRADDFHDPVFAQIYKAVAKLSLTGTPIDFVTVADRLKANDRIQQIGGSGFLAKIASEVPTASHVEKYAEIVIEHSRRRQLAKRGQRIVGLAFEDGHSSSELLENAEREFLKIAHESVAHAPVTLEEMREERFDRYTALYEADDATQHVGTRTGFPALDDLLTALAPGHFTVLAGRPSMGKTALALDIARHVGLKQNKTVAIFSLEMMKEDIFDRIFGSLAGIAPWKLNKGLLSEDQFTQMRSFQATSIVSNAC